MTGSNDPPSVLSQLYIVILYVHTCSVHINLLQMAGVTIFQTHLSASCLQYCSIGRMQKQVYLPEILDYINFTYLRKPRAMLLPDFISRKIGSGLGMGLYSTAENFQGRKLSRILRWLYAKVFSAKFGVWRPLARQEQAIRESFLRENRIAHQFAKVFSLKSFPLYGIHAILDFTAVYQPTGHAQ